MTIDAKTIIKNAMTSTGFTLTRVVQELNKIGADTTLQNLSNKINRGTIRFYEVEQALNVMGLTLGSQHLNLDNDIRHSLYPHVNQQELERIMNIVADPRVPYHLKVQLRNFLIHSNDNCRQIITTFSNITAQYLNQPLTYNDPQI